MRLSLSKREQPNTVQPITGKAFVLTNKGNMVPMTTIQEYVVKQEGAHNKEDSQQLKFEVDFSQKYGLLNKPYPPRVLLNLVDSIPVLWRCVKTSSIDIAGLGWEVLPRDEDKLDSQQEDNAMAFLSNPNQDGESLNDITEKLLFDYGSIGYYALEVAKGSGNKVQNIWHVPASEMFVHQSLKKYAQVRGRQITWFSNYHADITIDKETGSEKITTGEANHLIFKRNYYALSPAYGAPDFIPATGAGLGLIGIRDYNLAFFENHGIPAYLIKLEGQWDKATAGIIEEFLETEAKGAENAHKTFCLQLPTGGDITLQPLVTETKEGSFKMFKKAWMQDIMIAYAMPPYRIGIAEVGGLGGNTASEMTETYKQSTVTPAQTKLERIISDMLLKDGMGIDKYRLEFQDLDARDLDKEVERLVMLHSVGSVNANEIRKTLKLGKPVPGGEEYHVYATLGQTDEIRHNRNTQAKSANAMRSLIIPTLIDGIAQNPAFLEAIVDKLKE